MRLIRAIVFLAFIGLGGFAGFMYLRAGTIGFSFFEKNIPVVEVNIPQAPGSTSTLPSGSIGVGAEEKSITLKFLDQDSGLDEVIIRFEQDGRSHDIFKENTGAGVNEKSVSVGLNPKALGFKEGNAELKVSAFDRSFWVNGLQETIPVKIKYSRPRGEILTGQQNIALGGVEPIFYRVKDASGNISGVQVGPNFFPGYQASLLDPRFERFPDVYFSFFALPYNFSKGTDKVQLLIRDAVDNQATLSFNYLIIPRRFSTVAMKLGDPFLQKVFEELLPPYFEMSKEKPFKNSFEISTLSKEDKIAAFKLINESYRSLLLKELQKIIKDTAPRKYWQGTWQRPMRAAPTSTFAETRNYEYEGTYTSQSLHAGVDLADVTNAVVKPAAAGKILFADFLGIYGNAVVVDHGFGLTTVYGHLSSTSVNVGDEVSLETTLGRSGATGLAGGDHLHYEVRLHGVPVHPIEWWDGAWIREHIEKKINSVFDQLDAAGKLG